MLALGAQAECADSVGTKVKNGKVYILHKVEKGQGLYSISKKYGVSLSELIAENPGSQSVIKVDQIIMVPTSKEVKLEEPVVEDFFDKTDGLQDEEEKSEQENTDKSTYATYHTVEKGETLFAIARKYNTNVDVIKSLNYLSSDVISEGQRLLVPSSSDSAIGEINTEEYEIDVDAAVEELQVPKVKEGVVNTDTPVVEGYSIKVIRLEEYNLEKVEESGTSQISQEEIPNNKNFAYHASAPKGTVIMVTNPQNNKTVFVKVIGNFERAADSPMILKLSKLSASSIGIDVNGAAVKLSYAR